MQMLLLSGVVVAGLLILGLFGKSMHGVLAAVGRKVIEFREMLKIFEDDFLGR
jgi:ABC-type nitrate/sulfonate/bicarbonate transport system permease component